MSLGSLRAFFILPLIIPALALADQSSFTATYYRGVQFLPLSEPTADLFGGALRYLQLLDLTIPFSIFCLLAPLLAFASFIVPRRFWFPLSVAVLFLCSAFFSFKLSEGWDELFIGAKHASNFVTHNRFSYTNAYPSEGTSEFLPLFIVGVISKLGLPVLDVDLLFGLLGNLLLIVITLKIFLRLTDNSAAAIIFAAAVAVFPAILFASATGFFSPLFTAAILGTFYLLFIESSERARKCGLFLLSLLTLIRLEGIIITFLSWLYLFVASKIPELKQRSTRTAALKTAFLTGLFLVTPFIIASTTRYVVFGNFLPASVALKNAEGSLDFLAKGYAYLQSILYTFMILEVALLTLPVLLFGIFREKRVLHLFIATLITVIFSVPYIIGGGDWFPPSWARYLMPLVLTVYCTYWYSWSYLFSNLVTKNRCAGALFALLLVALPYLCTTALMDPTKPVNVFQHSREMLASKGFRWDRVDRLGYFGKFLDLTLPPDASIASAEEATIMFYAHRDAVDLAGFALRDVAESKFQPFGPGEVMHRKRNPAVIAKYRPAVIAFWEMAHLQRPPLYFQNDTNALNHTDGLVRMYGHSQFQIDVAYYRAGSFAYLQKLGYTFIGVLTPEALFWYWIDSKVLPYHTQKLAELGITQIGTREIFYSVSPAIAEKFESGV